MKTLNFILKNIEMFFHLYIILLTVILDTIQWLVIYIIYHQHPSYTFMILYAIGSILFVLFTVRKRALAKFKRNILKLIDKIENKSQKNKLKELTNS